MLIITSHDVINLDQIFLLSVESGNDVLSKKDIYVIRAYHSKICNEYAESDYIDIGMYYTRKEARNDLDKIRKAYSEGQKEVFIDDLHKYKIARR